MRDYFEERKCRSLLVELSYLGRGRSYFQRFHIKMVDDALRVCAPLTRGLFTLKPNTMLCCSGDYAHSLHIERASKSAKGKLGNHTELRGSSAIL
jgi:hypothetical protein